MDKKYLDTLKSLNLQPGKVKVKERVEVILNEQEDTKSKLMDFFKNNPGPADKDVHKFAESLGIDPDKFEGQVYAILGSFLGAGRAKEKNITEKDVSAEELKKGIKVEMEHTTDPILSARIALDHLAEIPDYYTRLIKMEKEAGIED